MLQIILSFLVAIRVVCQNPVRLSLNVKLAVIEVRKCLRLVVPRCPVVPPEPRSGIDHRPMARAVRTSSDQPAIPAGFVATSGGRFPVVSMV